MMRRRENRKWYAVVFFLMLLNFTLLTSIVIEEQDTVKVTEVGWFYLDTFHPIVNGSGFKSSVGQVVNITLTCGDCYFNSSIQNASVNSPFELVNFTNDVTYLDALVKMPNGHYDGWLDIFVRQ